MVDFLAVFSTPQAWVELGTLFFLELVLGIDNLVFIAITSDRLAEYHQSLGRKLGLLGALCMRIMLLCMISWLASLQVTLFTIGFLPGDMGNITARDIVMLVGGIYLVYKGIDEMIAKLRLEDEEAFETPEQAKSKEIGLVHAVALIMVMDVVFSLDSVITAVGLVNDLPIMILAVILAVVVMIIFADPISDFINKHSGVKILALGFIVLIGVVLVCEGLDIHLYKIAIYYAMGFALIVQIIEIKWKMKGVFVSMGVLLLVSIVLWLIFPDVIHLEMGFIGVAASAIIVYLQAVFQRNFDRKAEEQSLLKSDSTTDDTADSAEA